jgi:hypothetical protein
MRGEFLLGDKAGDLVIFFTLKEKLKSISSCV